jgi:hypothetical protein
VLYTSARYCTGVHQRRARVCTSGVHGCALAACCYTLVHTYTLWYYALEHAALVHTRAGAYWAGGVRPALCALGCSWMATYAGGVVQRAVVGVGVCTTVCTVC